MGDGRMEEELLNAWLRVTGALNMDDFVSGTTYNEAVICNLLYRSHKLGAGALTATDLCAKTHMLKSQMNRTLNEMEQKHLILRERSAQDRRRILITLDMSQIEVYEQQHQKNLALISRMLERVGREKGNDILRLLNEIADTAEEVCGNRKEKNT